MQDTAICRRDEHDERGPLVAIPITQREMIDHVEVGVGERRTASEVVPPELAHGGCALHRQQAPALTQGGRETCQEGGRSSVGAHAERAKGGLVSSCALIGR